MTESKYIAGAGGGGGKGGGGGSASRPKTDPDTLASVQFASVLDLLSEGEIAGIENDGTVANAWHKNIFLNGTPVKNADGSDNFRGASIFVRNGTQGQGYLSGFAATEREIPVSVEVTKDNPVTRTITDSNVDRVRVTLSIPALQKVESDNDIGGHEVEIAVQVQYNSGGFGTVINAGNGGFIRGKSSSLYQRDFLIDLNGDFPVDIRFKRISDDETSVDRSSSTFFQTYTEIIDDKFRYPNSALVGLRLDSRQFNSIPSRKYLIRGIKVKIPSNATVDTTTHLGRITYSGVWDGTFQSAVWTNDPAWILYDLTTSERYGAGVPESTLDKYDFYSISQYCNELVDDGAGGQEPRFSCNMLINSRDEVYNVIQQMTAIFRGIAYYGAGTLQLLQDKPTDAQYLLGPSNVVEGIFQYQGTSQKARHTVAVVAWQSYDTLGDVEYEYVEDSAAVAKYGIIKKDIKAIGCYSQGQAHRIGKWLLLSEQALTETCNFSVGIESGIILRPGTVVDIADPVKSSVRRSGRIKSATTTQITTDSSVDLTAALAVNNPKLSVLLSTGLVEQRDVSTDGITIVGDTAQINVETAFSEAPAAGSVFLFQNDDVQSQQFRVVSVAEAENGIYGVSAVAYNDTIYNAVETDNELTTRKISTLADPPNAPEGITGTEHLYQEGQTVHTGFELSWQHDRFNLNVFSVKYRLNNDNFTEITTEFPSLSIRALKAGTLNVEIRAISSVNKLSEAATATFQLVGKTAPPGNVQNLSIEPITANSARLRWDQTVDLDVKVNGRVHIRHSSLTDGTATWPNSVDLIPAVAGNSTEAIVPLVEGEILVKFEDDLGFKSVNATSVLVDFPDTLGRLLVQSRREDSDTPPFQGTKTDCFYDSSLDGLTIEGSSKIDDVTDFDAIVNFDDSGDILSSAEYAFNNTLDLGGVYSLDLARRFVTEAYFPDDTVDARNALIDTWADFDGPEADAVNAKLYMRSTNDDPSGTPTYGAWREFINGTFAGRGFQFKAELTSSDVGQNILVDELGYQATFQRRQENSNSAIASGTSTKSITFDKAFFTGTASLGGANAFLPSIGITVQNLGAGERVNVSSVTATGFNVDVLDSGGSNVDRNFTFSAVGYGKAV